MNLAEYHHNIEQIWTHIEEELESQGCDVDCDINGSVFSIVFSDRTQVVINKQEPLLELWLASRAGGFHFAYRNGQWISSNGELFWDCLAQACAEHGATVAFDMYKK